MKLIIQILAVVLLSIITIGSEAQSSKKADELYNRLGYQVAIPHFGDSEDLSKYELIKLATAYRLTGQSVESEMIYRNIIQVDKDPIHTLHFAQALLMNKKTEEALKYFKQYQATLTEDSSDKRAIKSIEFINSKEFDQHDNIHVDNVRILNSDNYEFSPRLTDEGLLFVSSRPAGRKEYFASTNYADFSSNTTEKDIWTEKDYNKIYFSSLDDNENFTEPVVFSKALNGLLHQGPMHLNSNEDLLYFTSSHTLNNTKNKNSNEVIPLQIYISVKTENGWSEAVNFPTLNTIEYNEAHPTLSKDGRTVIFASDRPEGQGGMDLYISTKTNGQWSAPLNMGSSVNTTGNELFPFIHSSGKLYFSSDGHGGYGGLDIQVIEFSNNEIKGKQPTNAGYPINSNKDDFGYTSDISDTKGYLSSSRMTSLGRDDIYSFERGPEKEDQNDDELIATTEEIQTSPIDQGLNQKFAENTTTEENENTNISENISDAEASTINKNINADQDYNTNNNEPVVFEDKVIEEGMSFELDKIYYDFDKSNLRPSSIPELNKLTVFLNRFPEVEIEIAAHTDSRGPQDYNRALSQRRANAVVDYLLQKGIDPYRIIAKGYGEDRLRNICHDDRSCSEKDHQYNRRTEFKVKGLDTKVNLSYTDNGPNAINGMNIEYKAIPASLEYMNEPKVSENINTSNHTPDDIFNINTQLSSDGPFVITVGAFSNPQKKIKKMNALGFDNITTANIPGRPGVSRVLIGGTDNMNTAQRISEALYEMGIKNDILKLD